jgi:uncharacterized protein (DUF983 family)
MKISAEVVKGQCPTCTEHTILVSIDKGLYRCMNCGTDLEQHINGKISYIPVLTTTPKTQGKFYLHDWDDEK